MLEYLLPISNGARLLQGAPAGLRVALQNVVQEFNCTRGVCFITCSITRGISGKRSRPQETPPRPPRRRRSARRALPRPCPRPPRANSRHGKRRYPASQNAGGPPPSGPAGELPRSPPPAPDTSARTGSAGACRPPTVGPSPTHLEILSWNG